MEEDKFLVFVISVQITKLIEKKINKTGSISLTKALVNLITEAIDNDVKIF